jgi:hypothetical protein
MRYQLSGCEEGQFPHDARAMLANREFGNAERFCDALAAQSSADLQQNFRFPIGETRHVPLLGGAISPEIEATASLPERSSTAGLPANRRAINENCFGVLRLEGRHARLFPDTVAAKIATVRRPWQAKPSPRFVTAVTLHAVDGGDRATILRWRLC